MNVNSSKMEYRLLSKEEKIFENIVFILEIMIEVILEASNKSPLF